MPFAVPHGNTLGLPLVVQVTAATSYGATGLVLLDLSERRLHLLPLERVVAARLLTADLRGLGTVYWFRHQQARLLKLTLDERRHPAGDGSLGWPGWDPAPPRRVPP
ncbi:hypothetical protein ACFW93_49595, partial [Streptomyces canus]|uniref:hypothetical protein n=1 Tax=Streptomyces canus TaxID=58343 RepID=UPI00369F531D